MIDVTLLNQTDDLLALEAEWDALVAAGDEDNPFRSWLWASTWWKHYGAGRELALLTARDGDQLLGLAPLFVDIERGWGSPRVLRFLGSSDGTCSEYLGLLVRQSCEQAVVPALLDFLYDQWRDGWDRLQLTDIPVESPQVEVLRHSIRQRRLVAAERPGTSNYIADLPASWDDYLATLSSRRRTKLRRILRDFEEQADIEMLCVEQEADLATAWSDVKRAHALHWQALGMEGCFASPQFDAFHTEMVERLFQQDKLLLGVIRHQGQPVAGCYAPTHAGVAYEYQRGHDPAWIKQQPGHALQIFLFREGIGGRLRRWDFLRGNYSHKQIWSNGQRSTVEFELASSRFVPQAMFRMSQGQRMMRRQLGAWRRRLQSAAAP